MSDPLESSVICKRAMLNAACYERAMSVLGACNERAMLMLLCCRAFYCCDAAAAAMSVLLFFSVLFL